MMTRRSRRFVLFPALLCLFVVLTLPLTRRAAMQETSGCAQVPSGIVSWYPADENGQEGGAAVDIVSHNDGTLQNGATFAPGKVGTAFSLDGVNDYVNVPDSDSLDLNTLTIDAWINRTSTADARIVDKITAGGADGYLLDIVNNHLRLIVGDAVVVSDDELPTDTYVLVAGTFDGTNLNLYINGLPEGTTTVEATSAPVNSLPLHIGANDAADGNFFAGQIDEVELFNRALDRSEIQSLVDADFLGKCRGSSPGQLIISEFRFRGPGATQPPPPALTRSSKSGGTRAPSIESDPNGYDEFIELYNSTDADIRVATTDGSAGWALATESNSVALAPSAVASPGGLVFAIVPNGTVIPARAHYLVANSEGYSLGGYPAGPDSTATPDQTYSQFDIPNDGGVALFNTADTSRFSTATRLDAVGFVAPPAPPAARSAVKQPGPLAVSDPLFYEGTGLTNPVFGDVEHSFVRRVPLNTGRSQDTNDNAADFQLVATDPVEFSGAVLGAPGPENLSSPRMMFVVSLLIDPCVARDAAPNRVRDAADKVAPFGSLTIRRRFINFIDRPMTRLRFRVVQITTQPAPSGTADLRALTSSPATIQVSGQNCTGSTPIDVLGVTLEEPPAQPGGGGLNSTLSAGTITLTSPLQPGDGINLQFLLGVQQTGHFDFFVTLEESFDSGGGALFSLSKHKTFSGGRLTTPTKGGGAKTKSVPPAHN
ncbi:MAG: LamG-like jellyroll fold domain-containing protein [Pyrinomonadaceae bacterium]